MTVQVPYLAEENIERDAESLLAEYAQARGVTLTLPILIEDIIEKHLKLRIEFDDLHRKLNIPRTGPEPEVIGAIWVDRQEIFLDESLDPEEHPEIEGRYRFTLAHEGGGHWRLHRSYLESDPTQAALFGGPTEPAVICRTSEARERVEWQADFYASCLLMPRKLVFQVWRERFRSMEPLIYEITRKSMRVVPAGGARLRHIGKIVGDSGYDEFADAWAEYIAPMFSVSRQAMRIRLECLGLLHRQVPQQSSLVGLA